MAGEIVSFTGQLHEPAPSPENTPQLTWGVLLSGYETLQQPIVITDDPEAFTFSPNPQYDRYLRMHKVFVGRSGASELEEIHDELRAEFMPRYLAVAGWAAAEAALVKTSSSVEERCCLLDQAVECWKRGIQNQQQLNSQAAEYAAEYATPHRLALNIAVAPLLEGLMNGNVSKQTCESVFVDCLQIAQSNAIYIDIMSKEKSIEGLAEHIGFGYECNALLAFNRRLSNTWFMIPSMTRSDSGYYHREQTHDLLVIHQRWGTLIDAAPVEIKASASAHDRERYKALLVRGKMHLSGIGKFAPEHTLQAIAAVYQGDANEAEQAIANEVSNRLMEMTRDYYAGAKLAEIATMRSCTSFRDNTQVKAKHPGLVRVAS